MSAADSSPARALPRPVALAGADSRTRAEPGTGSTPGAAHTPGEAPNRSAAHIPGTRSTPGAAHTPDTAPDPSESPNRATAHPPVLASIWAQDRHRVLGTGTGMLWHVPADFAHFRRETLGSPVIMGRASWEALGGALPGRPNIVITSDADYDAPGARVVTSLEGAVELGTALAQASGAATVWITGGGRVYAEAMDLVDELVVTDLDLDAVASSAHVGRVVRAPEIDSAVWTVDPARSDPDWRPVSGDARWRITTWVRR